MEPPGEQKKKLAKGPRRGRQRPCAVSISWFFAQKKNHKSSLSVCTLPLAWPRASESQCTTPPSRDLDPMADPVRTYISPRTMQARLMRRAGFVPCQATWLLSTASRLPYVPLTDATHTPSWQMELFGMPALVNTAQSVAVYKSPRITSSP